MKHLFTLSERLKGRGRGSVTSAISATSASAIFCKLVGMVKLFMPFMKATKRQSDTTFFAESLKSLMSIFAESAESAESAKPIFANRGVKDVRVSLDQSPTNIQRISNLYLTPNRYLTRFAAVFALVFVLGVGNVWGAPTTYNFSNLPTTGWNTSGGSQTINGKSWTYSSSTHISNNSSKIQVGSKNSPQTSNWTIQTAISNFGANKKITAVAITAYTTATTATYDISVGGSSVKSGSLTTSSATYTASSLNATSGNIVITLKGSSSSKAMYLSNIAVTYDDNSGPTLYTVTFDANGGSVTPASATQASAGAAITTPTPTRTGYTCSGWYTATSGGTKRCNAGGSYTPTATETIHAQWTPNNYSVNWVVNGNDWTGSTHGSPSTNANYDTKPATIPTAPTSSACDGSKVFVGWTNNEYEHATSAPAILFTTQANAPAITDNTTFYAVFATASSGGAATWTSTTLASLTGSDIFVISNGSYAMTNNNGTSSAPTATSITVSNGKITSTVNDNMKWNISGNSTDGYVFYPNGSTTTWLYCNTTASSSSNNNIRVGTGDRKLWVPNNSGYLVTNDTYTDRYLSVYTTTPDFRGYTGTSNGAFVPQIFKYSAGTTYSNYTTSCCTPLAQVEGSVNWSQPTEAEVSWDNIANVSSWTLKYKTHDAGSWTTAFAAKTGSDSEITVYSDGGTDNKMKSTIATTCNTAYDFLIIANPASGYCDKEQTLENKNSGKWSVAYSLTGVTQSSGPATGANVCGDYSAQFAVSGPAYALPDAITVKVGDEILDPSNYTWDSSTGALSIASAKITGNLSITVTGVEVGCSADPTIGAASLNGTFSNTSVGVTVATSSTGNQYCAWTDYGFVWGTSENPTVEGNKVVVGTSDAATTWNGSLTGSFETGVTYYFRAYGKNSKDDGEYVYGAGGSFTPRSVTFNSNGGSDVATAYVNSGEAIVAPSVPTKTGYDFDGWQLSGAAYDFAALVSGNIVLDAVWTAKTMDVTLDNQSATTAGTDKVTGIYDQGLPSIAENLPEKTGYTFQGYYSETGGNGTKYINADGTANGTWDKEVATTLYAYWTINNYTVTWKVAGNDYTTGVSASNNNANYNTTVSAPTAPAASLLGEQGCADTFMGWSKKNGGHDAKAASYYDDLFTETSPAITENTTFYAVFAKENGGTATATFDPANTTGLTESPTKTWTHTASGVKMQLVGSSSHYTNGTPKTWTMSHSSGSKTVITSPTNITQIVAKSVYQYESGNKTYTGYIKDASAGTLSPTSFTSGDADGDGNVTQTISNINAKSITIQDNSSSAGDQARVVLLTVTYSTTSYSDYVTECAPLTCSVPQSLASTPGKNGATLSWSVQEVGTASKYQYAVWAVGADEPTSGYSETTNLTATVSGLMSDTEYNWKVRTVCTGEDGESEFAKSTFTTGSVDLTFSVPTGVSSVTASTSASALPSADVPDACAGCWSFAGWSSDENATSVEYAAGGTYKFDGDKTLYAVYGKGSTTYEWISEIEELAANEYYIITAVSSKTEYALTNEGHASYAKDAKSLDITAKVEEDENGYYIQNPEANYIWKYTGTKLYNESANKYIQLSNYSSSSILDASGENLTFTVGNDGEWTIKNGSAYLNCYGSGFDASSSSSSVYIYKRQMGSLTTAPDCSGHTVEWYVAGAKVRTDEDITSCDGVASLPSVDVADIRCKTEGTTFMGWSETNVGVTPTSDADEIAALNLFTDAADAPAITADKQFYAVFAEGTPANPQAQTVTYTISAKNTLTTTGDAPTGSSATIAESYSASKQMTSGHSQTLRLTNFGAWKITKIVLSMKSNQNGGGGSLSYSTDGGETFREISSGAFNTSAWYGSWSTEYVDVTKNNLNIVCGDDDVVIKIAASANSLYCESYAITYEPIITYGDYFTECCPQKAITLSGVDDEVGKHFESDKEEACEGETVTLTKTENGNYTFGGFTVKDANDAAVDGTMNNVTGKYTFTMPETAVTVTAAWNPKNYEATAASADEGKGSVVVSGGSIEGGKRYVAYGSTITLTATPVDEDHYFQNWTVTPDMPELDLTQNPLVITMPGNNIDVTANFGTVAYPALTLETNEAYTLTATLANGEAIPNMGAIRSGTALKVSYVLNGQNEKTGWTLTPATTYGESENYITFNMPSEALNVALAVRPYYTLGLSAENGTISSVEIDDEPQTPTTTSYNVHAGEIVEVVATPTNDTYKFIGWEKTGIDENDFTENGAEATLEVASSNMTLKAVFEAKATYNLTLNALGRTQEVIPALEGTDVASLLEGKEAVTLKGYHFEGWSETEDGEAISGDALKLNGDKTVYAVYSAEAYYQKVTSTSEITDGQYLIVYEDGNKAFDGGASSLDEENNYISVTISNNKIESNTATDAASFTIDKDDKTIKSATNKYIGNSSDSNGLTESNSAMTNTMSIDEDGNFVAVSSGGAYLRYNSASNQLRFRYYKSSSYTGQKAIQLYKKVAPGANESNPTTVVANNEVLVIDEDATLNNLTIEAGGKVETTNELTVINNLTIESEAGKSGQVSNAGKVHANNVYMDVTFYKTATELDATSANQWYMISAPFDVNLNGGFFQTDGTPMVFTVAAAPNSFDLFEYNGSKRASTGKTGWKRASGKMNAGVAYLIGFEAGQSTTIRLKAANTTMTDKDAITLNTYTSTIGTEEENAKNSNWNGVANPNLHYISINKDAQTYDNDARSYNPSTSGSTSYVVGTAFFIHGKEDASIVNTIHSDLRAPRRATEALPIEFCVRLQQENASWANRMYIRASEEASAHYEAGRDLETMNGTNGNNALLWSNNYGMRLAIEEAPIVNDKASYALSLYAPANGTYRIETPTESDNADLYLTKDGHVIWNLSMGTYEVELTKGTTEGYGLLLVRKAPSVATGVDEVESQESKAESAEKVIIDEHVYILRDGQMYDVTGKAVK